MLTVGALRFVPEHRRTLDICTVAAKSAKGNRYCESAIFEYIPKELHAAIQPENEFPHIDFGKELSQDELDEILTQAKETEGCE